MEPGFWVDIRATGRRGDAFRATGCRSWSVDAWGRGELVGSGGLALLVGPGVVRSQLREGSFPPELTGNPSQRLLPVESRRRGHGWFLPGLPGVQFTSALVLRCTSICCGRSAVLTTRVSTHK